jgi:hypothetical protein
MCFRRGSTVCHVSFKVLTRISQMILQILNSNVHLDEDATFLLKFWLKYREWYCKYSMSLVICKSPLSEIILIFCLKMKNKSCPRLVHFNKLLFCWKYTITNDQTPIKYFKGELKHVLFQNIRREITVKD